MKIIKFEVKEHRQEAEFKIKDATVTASGSFTPPKIEEKQSNLTTGSYADS